MNWDRVEGQWKQRRGKAVHQWGKVMNDELAAIAGRHEALVGKLQERYGIATEEARTRVQEYKKIVGELRKANLRLVQLQRSLHERESSGRRSRAPAQGKPPKRARKRPPG